MEKSVCEFIGAKVREFMVVCMSFAFIPLAQQCGTTILEGDDIPVETGEVVEQDFETISKGTNSGYTKRASLVITDEETWAQVWEIHNKTKRPIPELPEVDFFSSMVVAVFRGEVPTGGYSTEITRVETLTDEIVVTVVEADPGEDFVIQIMTQPYHIIKLEKSDLSIQFVYVTEQ